MSDEITLYAYPENKNMVNDTQHIQEPLQASQGNRTKLWFTNYVMQGIKPQPLFNHECLNIEKEH